MYPLQSKRAGFKIKKGIDVSFLGAYLLYQPICMYVQKKYCAGCLQHLQ